jgi:hypothetical protein
VADKPKPAAFVPLTSVRQGPAPADPAAALAEIRQIYFKTTKRTIEHDFAHAIELLKRLPDEDTRARAHVYMEGLAEMQREWAKPPRPPAARRKGKRPPTSGSRSSGGR